MLSAGVDPDTAHREAEERVNAWIAAQEGELALRYERELMNPNEALSLGSISQIVMPAVARKIET